MKVLFVPSGFLALTIVLPNRGMGKVLIVANGFAFCGLMLFTKVTPT
jgi:hypothetical protein